MHVLNDPVERLQIAQSAFAFLHVRLDQIAGIALAGMPVIAFFELVGDEFGVLAIYGLAVEQLARLVCQALITK